jgi:membrane protein required for colicin V production
VNWLDIILAGLAAAGFFKGYSDGFIRQGVMLAALLAAVYLCSKVATSLREYVLQTGWFPEYAVTAASYVLAFVLIAGIIMLAGEIVHRMVDVTPLSLINRLAGGAFALIITVVLLSLTLNMLEGLDRRSTLLPNETKVESRLYLYVKDLIPAIYPAEQLFIWKK